MATELYEIMGRISAQKNLIIEAGLEPFGIMLGDDREQLGKELMLCLNQRVKDPILIENNLALHLDFIEMMQGSVIVDGLSIYSMQKTEKTFVMARIKNA